ncbi:hypothetical protein C2845_PM15G16150 [Panicum miliaceum]|uniref:Uncharacterized protein n=1 Tax=Panicum miliaceum TaxID=4540 RepID=A0A3L6Q9L5_PANMI|nr:hypothetical protein C2845_PM15G16150 [Panicum miliaceum]
MDARKKEKIMVPQAQHIKVEGQVKERVGLCGGLQKDDDKKLLQAGAGVLKAAALEFHAQVYGAVGEKPKMLLA